MDQAPLPEVRDADEPPAPVPADRKIRIGKRTFTILFPELLRPLGDRDRQDLKNSIRKMGVVVPIVVDEFDGIIDGINRATLAAEVGMVGIGTDVRSHLDAEAKAALAMTLNADRRHLTPTEKKDLAESRKERIAAAADLRRRGDSQRVIAEKLKVSQTQVAADLKAATEQGCSVAPDGGLITGKDGRKTNTAKIGKGTISRYSTAGTSMNPRTSAKKKLAEEARQFIAERKREAEASTEEEALAEPETPFAEHEADPDAHCVPAPLPDARFENMTRDTERLVRDQQEARQRARADGPRPIQLADVMAEDGGVVSSDGRSYDHGEVSRLGKALWGDIYSNAIGRDRRDGFEAGFGLEGFDGDWTPAEVLEGLMTHRAKWQGFIERLDAIIALHREKWKL